MSETPAIEAALMAVALARSSDTDETPLRDREGAVRTLADLWCSWIEEGDLARSRIDHGLPLCESPIERVALAAMMTADWAPFSRSRPIICTTESLPAPSEVGVAIVPQFAFDRFRLDFGVFLDWSPIQMIAVECDGKEFHDAGRDRDRDAYLATWGIPTFRITGSEINTSPRGAVFDIVQTLKRWRLRGDASLKDGALELIGRAP